MNNKVRDMVASVRASGRPATRVTLPSDTLLRDLKKTSLPTKGSDSLRLKVSSSTLASKSRAAEINAPMVVADRRTCDTIQHDPASGDTCATYLAGTHTSGKDPQRKTKKKRKSDNTRTLDIVADPGDVLMVLHVHSGEVAMDIVLRGEPRFEAALEAAKDGKLVVVPLPSGGGKVRFHVRRSNSHYVIVPPLSGGVYVFIVLGVTLHAADLMISTTAGLTEDEQQSLFVPSGEGGSSSRANPTVRAVAAVLDFGPAHVADRSPGKRKRQLQQSEQQDASHPHASSLGSPKRHCGAYSSPSTTAGAAAAAASPSYGTQYPASPSESTDVDDDDDDDDFMSSWSHPQLPPSAMAPSSHTLAASPSGSSAPGPLDMTYSLPPSAAATPSSTPPSHSESTTTLSGSYPEQDLVNPLPLNSKVDELKPKEIEDLISQGVLDKFNLRDHDGDAVMPQA